MLYNKIIFFSETLTERLQYVAQLIFAEHLGLNIFFTTNTALFKKSELPKIAYATHDKGDNSVFFIEKKSNILFENNISTEDAISVFQQADVLGQIFILITRYEEYNRDPSVFDHHNRFSAAQSISQKLEILHKPIVNQWIIQIKNQLCEKFLDLKYKESEFSFLPTYDIDQAWSVMHKGLLRNVGGLIKELFRGQIKAAINRFLILISIKNDPEYTFDFLKQLDKKFQLNPIYFWLLADHAEFDKNIDWQNRPFQNLIRRIAKTYKIGLHPSYASNNDVVTLIKEKDRFMTIAKRPLSISRQHYLKLRFPETYRRLIDIGLDEDYSMGYADDVGFRAGISTPFYWFDLERNQITNLKIFPFAVMEVTLKEYLHLNPEEAVLKTKKLVDEVKNVNGLFISLWHNSTLSDKNDWQGWRKVYTDMLEYICVKD
jgi:hypothetical protein